MALNNSRVQLLANLKCLYGSDVEVLTLCIDTVPEKYQAVAMSFDPFTATWTKFLHSAPNCTSTRDAIGTLLRESERELAKLLSVNGNTIPFQGIMVQPVTLYRGRQSNSSAGSSVRSETVFVATPGLTLSDHTVPDEFVDEEHPLEETASKEPLVDESPVEEAVVKDVDKEPLAEEPISVSEEPVSRESEIISFDWSSWGISKKDKKKKKAGFIFDETQPVEEYPTEVPAEDLPAEVTVEESRVEVGHYAEEVSSPYDIVEEVSACHPEPDAPPEDDFGWGSFGATKKNKKKKGRKSIGMEMSTPPPEPEPAAEPTEDFSWGSFSTSKKKKGRTLIEEETLPPPPPPPEAEAEPVSEPVEVFEGGSFIHSKKDKKKKGEKLIEEAAPPQSELVPETTDEFDWGSFHSSKKNKGGKTVIEEPKLHDPPPVPSPPPSPPHSESRSRIEDGVWETLRPEAPLPPESVGYPTVSSSLTAAPSSEITADTLQTQVARSRQTVVFTIQFPNEISNKPLRVMTTIVDNTRTAIIDSVNSYLDSKSILKGMQGQRRLEIKYGVGRNGDVDLSTLEEVMWPEYLDYFRQYTRIPELTVNIVEC